LKKGAKTEFAKFLTIGAFFKTFIKQFVFSKNSVFYGFFGQKLFKVLIALYAKFDCKCAKEMLSLIEQKEIFFSNILLNPIEIPKNASMTAMHPNSMATV
jgi:hypothetical protein